MCSWYFYKGAKDKYSVLNFVLYLFLLYAEYSQLKDNFLLFLLRNFDEKKKFGESKNESEFWK
jgi:hypothetical protein